MVKPPKSPCKQSLLGRTYFAGSADAGVWDDVLPEDEDNSVQAEVIEEPKLVKVTTSHWLCLTAIEKDRPDQSLVDVNLHVDFDLRSTPQPILNLTKHNMGSIDIFLFLTNGG